MLKTAISRKLIPLLLCLALMATVGCSPDEGDLIPPSVTFDGAQTPRNDPNVTLTGTMEEGAEVVAESDVGATFGTVTYPTPTTWSVDATLVDGSNVIGIRATDIAGNSTTLLFSLFLDRTGPTIATNQFQTPAANSVTSQVLAGTTGELGAEVSLDQSTWFPANSDIWQLNVTGLLADTVNTVDIYGRDLLGNVSGPFNVDLELAATSPVLTVASPAIPVVIADPVNDDFVTVSGSKDTACELSATSTSGVVALTGEGVGSTAWSADLTLLGSGITQLVLTENGTGCSGTSVAYVLVVRDLTAASVLDSVPTNGARITAPYPTDITVIFSEDMDFATIAAENLTVTDSAGTTVTVSGVTQVDSRTYDFSIGALAIDETYDVQLSGTTSFTVSDTQGNPLSATFAWSFRTE